MGSTLTQPKLTCPHCDQKLRFNTQPRERAKIKCPNCHGYLIFSANDSNTETEVYELESPNFEVPDSDFNKPTPVDSEEPPSLPSPRNPVPSNPTLSRTLKSFCRWLGWPGDPWYYLYTRAWAKTLFGLGVLTGIPLLITLIALAAYLPRLTTGFWLVYIFYIVSFIVTFGAGMAVFTIILILADIGSQLRIMNQRSQDKS
jgi:hypothetical protein